MRGQWDHEQPLSPSLLRSALALIGGFLAALALIVMAQGVLNLSEGRWLTAIVQFTGGVAFPFAIWLGLRMLGDVLVMQHRSHDKLEIIAERLGHPVQPAPRAKPETAEAARAGDDGPAYPGED